MALKLGNCHVTVTRNIDDVLAQTPKGKTAMFRVISIPSRVPDDILGEHVYVKQGEVYSFMCDERVNGLKAEDLLFISYV